VLGGAVPKPLGGQAGSRLAHHVLHVGAAMLTVVLDHQIEQAALIAVGGIETRRGDTHGPRELSYRRSFISLPSKQLDGAFERGISIEGSGASSGHA
jgi:hypothetical protein